MPAPISNTISTLMKNFTLLPEKLFSINNPSSVIKFDFKKASNSAMKFTPSFTEPPKASVTKMPFSERNIIYARKLSDNFTAKHGKFLQDLNSRLATGRPSPIKKSFVAAPVPTPITVNTFTPPAPVKQGNMGMPPPPPPMPPASYVPPRIIHIDTARSEPAVREKKSIKPETTPKYNSVMDELKKRFGVSSSEVQ